MTMRRFVQRTAAPLTLAIVAAGVLVLGAAGTAGADPSSGAQIPSAAQPIGAYKAGAPFSSGQTIEVTVPANSVLGAGQSVRVVECAASILRPTTDAKAVEKCDGLTIQGDTILTNADGSFAYKKFQVYALPDHTSLQEAASNLPVCDLSHACVLYIGLDQTHPITSKHFFSQEFSVAPTVGDTGANPGSGGAQPGGAPAALIAMVVIVAVALGALGTVLYRRRRHSSRGPSGQSARRPHPVRAGQPVGR